MSSYRSQHLVVQPQQLLFIAARFLLLSFVQLSDLPQLFSQLPYLLLQSLLITAPRALRYATQTTSQHTHCVPTQVSKRFTV